ncbi:MAG: alpha/beta hydrolase [Solirubrobacterales bacterium]|nr:alpha/beta hydrolase [Solirubrobacterales bacterium]
MSDLHFIDRGEGPPVLLIHGTGTDSSVFDEPVGALAGSWRLITPDRRGWGQSVPVDEYRRTSIAEQAIEIGALVRELDLDRVTAVGIGLGAVVALEMALADPDLIDRAFLIEPPVFAALKEATEGMSADVEAIRSAAAEGGEGAAYELFLSGALHTLGAGAERFGDVADRGPAAARSFLIEVPAVPAWPLDPLRLASLEADVTVVTLPSTPALLKRAAEAIFERVPGAESVHSNRDGAGAVTTLLG